MVSTSETQSLESWFRIHGGYIHPNIQIQGDLFSGIHFRATGSVPPGTTFASSPHSLALSYLNALVDDDFPVFKQQRHRFKVEAIGFWYLMIQYINREKSFWKPYLDTLPSPEAEWTQPVWFENDADVKWLEETDAWFTITARKDVYSKYYSEGEDVLRQSGMDTEPYTWNLFKWAVSIFTSRSFASRALHSETSKYWTTYKTSSSGARQTVVLDMSSTPPEDLEFPVLFPGLDAANHNHDAKIEWTFDPGQFSLELSSESAGVEAGSEVFNNYGPKGNGELLLGYGFCIENNPHDTVAMTLKSPPPSLQEELKTVHPGYFKSDGTWDSEKSNFYLKNPGTDNENNDILKHLPEPLLELLIYILRSERNLPFKFIENPSTYLFDDGSPGQQYTPYIGRMMHESLVEKWISLHASGPSSNIHTPETAKQKQAGIYRVSQLTILNNYNNELRALIRDIAQRSKFEDEIPANAGNCLLTIPRLINVISPLGAADEAFLKGVEANTNSQDFRLLWVNGWEDDLWVLLLTYAILSHGFESVYAQHLRRPFANFLSLVSDEDTEGVDAAPLEDMTDREKENSEALLDFVETAKEVCGEWSVWADKRWNQRLLVQVGRQFFDGQSFQIAMMPPAGVDGEKPSFASSMPRSFLHLWVGPPDE